MPDVLAKMSVDIAGDVSGLTKSLNLASGKLGSFSSSVSGAVGTIKGALATLGLGLIGREIIDVTAQFQKFGAVLTNTLGSSSAAQIALRDIEKFAAKTPFAVDELTSSFVKLANQGFTPTTDELRKLGDVASSTGKGFDQLTEAIIDAQVGEFERLKEFGIRASKQGDQVKFTFKGVETQTKFTASAIRDYILSLGEAEGVSGAMGAISATLGGQISNLGDQWTQFLKIIGDGNKGALSVATKGLTFLLQKAAEFLKTNQQVQEELQVDAQASILEELKDLEKITGDLDGSAFKLTARLEEEKQALVDLAAPLFKNFEENEKQIEGYNNQAKAIDAAVIAINDYVKSQEKKAAVDAKANKSAVEAFPTNSVKAFQKEISKLNEQILKTNVSDTDRIRLLGEEIVSYDNAIKRVDQLRKVLSNLVDTPLKMPDLSGLLNPINEVSKTEGGVTFKVNEAAFDASMNRIEARIKKTAGVIKNTTDETSKGIEVSLTGPIANAIDGLAEALGRAAVGVGNFGQDILKVVANFGAQLGKILIAEGVALLAAKFALKNPYTAIAAGVALVAISSALSSSISTAHSKAFGGSAGGAGGSGPGTNVSRFNSDTPRVQIELGGKFIAVGKDLQVVLDNQNIRSQRTG